MTGYLRVDDVDLWFGGTHALDHVDFQVGEGEIFGIIGPNGAGKSSLLNCINGYYRPSAGQVIFEGLSLNGLRPHRIAKLGVGRTFQNIELSPDETVLQNVLLGRHIHMRSGAVREMLQIGPGRREEARHRERAEEILAFFDLSELRHHPVASLPYGRQKLVELARGIAMEPKLLLLDEPTAGMTATERAEVGAQVQRMRSELGITQILIEHDAGFIRGLCDRVVVLDFGCVIALGEPDDVMRDPRVIEAYLGQSTAGAD